MPTWNLVETSHWKQSIYQLKKVSIIVPKIDNILHKETQCMPAQSCLILCNPTDCSPPDSSIHKILQARTLVWVAISYSRGSSWLRDWTCISCIAGRFFTTEPPGRSIPKTKTNTSSIAWSQNTNSTNNNKKKKSKKKIVRISESAIFLTL